MPDYVGPPIGDPTYTPPPDLGPATPAVNSGVVAEIPDPPTADNVGNDDYRYQGWGQVTATERWTGVVQNAIAGPAGTPADIQRMHGGKGRKTVAGVALRIGAHPEFPSSNTDQANEALSYARVVGFSPQQVPGGVRVYGVIWLYIYELQVPFSETDSITWGQPPSDAGDAEQINPADYSSYLNAPSLAPTAFNGQPVNY